MWRATSRSTGIAWVLGAVATASPSFAGDPPARQGLPPSPPRTKEFLERVDRAVEHGSSWLRARQGPDGRFLSQWGDGETALAVLALRVGGGSGEDPQVLRGPERLRDAYPTGGQFSRPNSTYGAALTLLALEAHYNSGTLSEQPIPAGDRDWIAALADYLVRSQVAGGGFGYGADEPLPGGVDPGARARYWDNSNSQFALLGLGAARLLGQEVPAEVWRRSLLHWIRTQQVSGPTVPRYEPAGKEGTLYATGEAWARGWSYQESHGEATGSITAGGVSSLALCRNALAKEPHLAPEVEESSSAALRDGLAWLGRYFTVEGNPLSVVAPPDPGAPPPPPPPAPRGKPRRGKAREPEAEDPPASTRPLLDPDWHFYYLYGLERAGVLGGTAWIGTHDWYLEGAEYLLRVQREDGSWGGSPSSPGEERQGVVAMTPLVDTCFALLFLRRATTRLHTPSRARTGTPTAPASAGLDPSTGQALQGAAFRDLFEAVFRRYAEWGPKERAERAPDFVRMGARAIPLLIQRLGSADEETRAAAADALRRTTGEAHGYDASDPPESRDQAILVWEEWWSARGAGVVEDGAAGRFRVGE